ncbi:MAG: hypothetical protein GTO42_01280 [Candidatus Latescibacteria bacterium]|nr:hypothetical protein [Candidatus Latescibacterota bacterium]NIO27161.1 hypothetical protein [Candidatus Latescibacterota bacterium]NIO54685.1 hypothetical protein [Candidatus Latescibacterota bacterium]NIT00768.1 hypothetical protein [Candidatus Latescibacterota bacterium]NIT37691.1 hypothetical protein [Candidatus Latescibacterota bacterium]
MRVLRSKKSMYLIVSNIVVGFILGCTSREPDERFLQKTYVNLGSGIF